MPLALQEIGPIDARCYDLDQHLVRSRTRCFDILELEYIRRARLRCNDGFHAAQRATGWRMYRLGSGCSPPSRASETPPGEVA